MGHETRPMLVFGWPTWTINPDILLANPLSPRWAAKHLSLTPTGISFLQLPTILTPIQDISGASLRNRPYFLIEADPDEETSTWNCRTWVNYHPLKTASENYLLALTVHAATTEPSYLTAIGPVKGNDDDWETTWRNQTRNSLPNPALMTYYQFYQHAWNLTAKLELWNTASA